MPDGINLRFGWPAGEWGGIPIEGGVAAAYRREIDAAKVPEAHRQAIEDVVDGRQTSIVGRFIREGIASVWNM